MDALAASPLRTATRSALEAPLVYWHLLSLDAPSVAALWTSFIARSAHIHLPVTSTAAMFLAVWILYAADRLLDARLLDARPIDARPIDARAIDTRLIDARLIDTLLINTGHPDTALPHPDTARPHPDAALPDPDTSQNGLEARHLFHHIHRRPFRLAILLAALTLAPLLLTIPAEAIRLYLIAGALLFAWFVLIHAAPVLQGKKAVRLPKELAVGVFFAAAIFIPTVSRVPTLRLALLPAALLFAVLCSLNCLFIYAWEHTVPGQLDLAHPTTRLALSHLTRIALALILFALALGIFQHDHLSPAAFAMAASAAILLVLDKTRFTSRTALRAAADLALLTPILFLPFQR